MAFGPLNSAMSAFMSEAVCMHDVKLPVERICMAPSHCSSPCGPSAEQPSNSSSRATSWNGHFDPSRTARYWMTSPGVHTTLPIACVVTEEVTVDVAVVVSDEVAVELSDVVAEVTTEVVADVDPVVDTDVVAVDVTVEEWVVLSQLMKVPLT